MLPILYCIIDGLGTFSDALVLDGLSLLTEEEANISYEFTFLICAIAAWIYLVVVKKRKFSLWGERIKGRRRNLRNDRAVFLCLCHCR